MKPDLVERLRDSARCALTMDAEHRLQEAADAVEALIAENAALKEEVGRLRAMLKPFADEADEWGASVPDDYAPLCVEPGHWDARYYGSPARFTVGDQRRARAALHPQEPKP